MAKSKYCYATDFFPPDLVKATESFIATLSGDKIRENRHAYQRELNASKPDNEVPEHTVEKRRCFLYLTAKFG